MTTNMLQRLAGMVHGRKVCSGRGPTMVALEERGLVKRHLPENPKWGFRFTITDAGRDAVKDSTKCPGHGSDLVDGICPDCEIESPEFDACQL